MNVVPGSASDLTDQQRDLFKRITGEDATPYKYGGAQSIIGSTAGVARKAVDVVAEFGKGMVPQTGLDWAFLIATMPWDEVVAIGRVLNMIGNPLVRMGIKEAPAALKAAAEIAPAVEDLIKVGKYTEVPVEVEHAVQERLTGSAEKLLGGPRPGPKPGVTMLEGPETWEFPERSPENKPGGIQADEEAQLREAPPHLRPPPSRAARLADVGKTLMKNKWLIPVRGAAAGAAYQAATGGDITEGVERGAITGGIGAGTGGVTEAISSGLFPNAKVNSGVRQFGKALAEELPELKGQLKDPMDIDRLFRSQEVEKMYGNRARAVQQVIGERLHPGQTFKIPMPEGGDMDVTYNQALEYIRQMEQMGYNDFGPAGRMGARRFRMAAAQAIGAMQEQLDNLAPGLGEHWAGVRRNYGAAKELTRMFRTEGVFTPQGINWPKVQGLLAGKYRAPLNTMFGPDAAESIAIGARRGAPLGGPTDQPGGRGKWNVHMPGLPVSRNIGTGYKAVGNMVRPGSMIGHAGALAYLQATDAGESPEPGLAEMNPPPGKE